MDCFKKTIITFGMFLLGFTSLLSQQLNPIEFLDSLKEIHLIDKGEREFVTFLNKGYTYTYNKTGWFDSKDSTLLTESGQIFYLDKYDTLKSLDYLASHRAIIQDKENNPHYLSYSKDLLLVAIRAHNMGDDNLAISYYEKATNNFYARTRKDAIKIMREHLAWPVYFSMITDFENGYDSSAFITAQLYKQRHIGLKKYNQAEALYYDLERRVSKPIEQLDSLPTGFDKWTKETKINFLIPQLENITAPQLSYPGEINALFDLKAQALVNLGYEVVDTLIYIMKNDKRFIRSLHSQRSFDSRRSIIQVSNATLQILEQILLKEFYHPYSTSSCFTLENKSYKNLIIQEIEDYWSENKSISVDEALMKRIKDTNSNINTREEALRRITQLHRMAKNGWLTISDVGIKNPAIKKYAKPSVLELGLQILRSKTDTILDEETRLQEHKQYIRWFELYGDSNIYQFSKKIIEKESSLLIKLAWIDYVGQYGKIKYETTIADKLIHHKFKIDSVGHRENSNHLNKKEITELIEVISKSKNKKSIKAMSKISKQKHEFYPIWKEIETIRKTSNFF